jgi:methylmalonyl-CoA/ethylmalonyl-CoA epimerase
MAAARVHHIGFVVASIAASIDGFVRSLSAEWDGKVFADPHQRVKVTFLSTGPADPQIELVEPAEAGSPVGKFLVDQGGGLHHVCYEVDDLELEIRERRSKGGLIAKRPKPAVAFDGRRIAWLITSEQMLIELLERSPKDIGKMPPGTAETKA